MIALPYPPPGFVGFSPGNLHQYSVVATRKGITGNNDIHNMKYNPHCKPDVNSDAPEEFTIKYLKLRII